MRYEQTLSVILTILSLCCLTLILDVSAPAQSPQREKPTLKDFGKSLKRLKWDSKQKKAVEVKNKNEEKTVSDDDVIRVETTLVVSDVLVLDKKGFSVQGLTQNDFIITQDNKLQEISIFSLGNDASVPRSIVLIIDNSGSQKPFINLSVEAAKNLVDKLRPNDRMAVVTDAMRLLVGFTNDKTELKSKLELFKSEPGLGHPKGSIQYSALMATLRELIDEEDIRPIIVFQTDGDELSIMRPLPDNALGSRATDLARPFSLKDVFAAAEKSRVTIYTVIPGIRLKGLPPNEQMERAGEFYKKYDYSSVINYQLSVNVRSRFPTKREKEKMENYFFNRFVENKLQEQSALEGLSNLTGGWAEYLEDPAQAEAIYTRILTNVGNRYVVGYYPVNQENDGKRRNVKVEVRGHPEYTIVGRKTYIAPEKEK